MKNDYQINIGWLYPDLMSTYGDRGNVQMLMQLCKWNGIQTIIVPITNDSSADEIKELDFIFGGGSQDIQQEIVMRDLLGKKGEEIKKRIEENVPALFVCGSPQIMGISYEPALGKKIPGLEVFDMVSVNPGIDKPRCIGNIIATVNWDYLESELADKKTTIVGFENHGGRTYLGKNVKPFAHVLHGYGNNGEDGTEGVVYKNAVGCYFHGPLLPKNPEIAEFFIKKVIQVKYNSQITLTSNTGNVLLADKARQVITSRYSK